MRAKAYGTLEVHKRTRTRYIISADSHRGERKTQNKGKTKGIYRAEVQGLALDAVVVPHSFLFRKHWFPRHQVKPHRCARLLEETGAKCHQAAAARGNVLSTMRAMFVGEYEDKDECAANGVFVVSYTWTTTREESGPN